MTEFEVPSITLLGPARVVLFVVAVGVDGELDWTRASLLAIAPWRWLAVCAQGVVVLYLAALRLLDLEPLAWRTVLVPVSA